MSNNQINVSVTPTKNFKVSVSAPSKTGEITVSPDTSAYNAEIARQWAISDTKVLQEDYSSKYYANKSQTSANTAKVYADNAQGVLTQVQGLGTEAIEEINTTKTSAVAEIETIKTNAVNTANEANTVINTNKTNAINEINTTKNSAVSSVNTTKTSAITEINNTKTTAVNAVNTSKNEALNAIANAGINDLANKDLSNLSEVGQAKFDEKVDLDDMVEINLGNSFELFDTKLTDHVLTYEETKGWALQGTYVYKTALAGSRYGYPDFYNKVLEEYNQATTTETVNGVTVKVHSNGHKFYNIADKEAIDGFFNAMGSAWFYGVDTENERIFLPRNNYFEQATGDVSEVGKTIEAGLPNITGTITPYKGFYSATYTGAFYDISSTGQVASGATDTARKYGFDASLSNPIYGNSDTVQPNAVKKLLYICVGNTTNYEGVTDVVNQGMEILEQVNQGIEQMEAGLELKVDKSSMQEVPCIVETYVNGYSWYRVYSDGWCEQGGGSYQSSNGGHRNTTVTLLKPFIDTNYSISITSRFNSSTGEGTNYFANPQTTSFTAYICGYGFTWQACGYIA